MLKNKSFLPKCGRPYVQFLFRVQACICDSTMAGPGSGSDTRSWVVRVMTAHWRHVETELFARASCTHPLSVEAASTLGPAPRHHHHLSRGQDDTCLGRAQTLP